MGQSKLLPLSGQREIKGDAILLAWFSKKTNSILKLEQEIFRFVKIQSHFYPECGSSKSYETTILIRKRVVITHKRQQRKVKTSFFFTMVQQLPMGQDVLIIEDSLSHSDTRTLGRISLDEWSTRRRDLYLTTHNAHIQTNIHAPSGIRNRNPSKGAATDSCLRQRGYWG